MARARTWLGLAAAVLLLSPPAHASAFSERLREADAARTSDPARFTSILAGLERDRSRASLREQQYLRLLRNYQRHLRGEYTAAVQDSVALFNEAEDPEIRYRSAILVANASAATREFTLGLRYLERALGMRGTFKDRRIRAQSEAVASVVYNHFAQYGLGKQYADLVVAAAPDTRTTCYGRVEQIVAMYGMGSALDEAADIKPAIDACIDAGEPIGANLIRSTLAQHWAGKGRRAESVQLLEKNLPEVYATKYRHLIGEFHSLLGRYKYELGDGIAAQTHASRVLALTAGDTGWLPHVRARYVLYRVALDRGDYRNALMHYRRYAEADKARLDDIKAREYAFQLSRHELDRKNRSIKLLSNENQVLRLQQEVARRSAWNFRLAIALLAVIAASAAYWGWRARRTHRSLHQLANTDALTGLANRRHFRASAEAILKACEQRARPVSVLLFDLDHFKQINDQCGHSSGDWVLREVARVGRQHCREGDLYGRIGGEEFAMALVDCDVDAALRIAERCRLSIQGIDATTGAGCPLPVAASIGVVSTSISGYDYEMLIAHADAAMYRSKVAGRNRVTLYQPPPVPEGGRVVALDGRNAGAMLREY
ncbi:GGDEF domain-containing protein [Lysobacter sp. N42]|uniref:GGDEF domain-containing protein n=1 Tax=Lysobacter sp. N42 TaxID=2545719 RepID=UPI001048A8CD|nr:GGDEF domain-containing protein [Lysobacter sp. N42]TCZ82614.1 GGDEF domain-containing protein [Lysobacter sp. N42]